MPEIPSDTKSTAREYFESLVITVILALFGTTFIVQAFKIPTPSMENNLLVGDHLLVNKFVFGSPGSLLDAVLPFKQVERGDVIVFRFPLDLTKHYVKRVVGLPGERLRIDNQQVYVDSVALDESYKRHTSPPGSYVDPFRDYFPPRPDHARRDYVASDQDPYWYEDFMDGGEILVPEGHYFAMGDNRDNSSDSRYWGFVPIENIVGRALIIYWSYETDSEDYRQTAVGDRFQQVLDLATNFFRKTRWHRTFQIIH